MKSTQLLAALVGGLALGACAATGGGRALVEDREGARAAADLHWRSAATNPREGALRLELPGGPEFLGEFFQVEPDAPPEQLEALWGPWPTGWTDWPLPWETREDIADVEAPSQSFRERYDGMMVASLEDEEGRRMRCRFALLDARRGFAAGAGGDCQLEGEAETISSLLRDAPAGGPPERSRAVTRR